MSWDCPICKTENTSGSKVCIGCEAELPAPYDGPEVEPDPSEEVLTKQDIDEMLAMGERFMDLVRGKSMRDVVNAKMQNSTEAYIKSSIVRLQQGADPVTAIVMAIAWGLFVAEHGGSNLKSYETNPLLH